jgi:two-component system OmpR family response regulator
MHILVVEDQQDFAQNIRRYLETESYSVDLAFDGESGLQQGLSEEYALVVLDLNLPRMDGLEVCRQLRRSGRSMPILMLTARVGRDNTVAGLDSGADDYLTKPFDLEELLARMRALLRRGGESRSPIIVVGDVTVDTNTHEVRKDGKLVALAPREYALLEFLALNRGIAKSRLEIIELVWGEYDELMFSQTVDVHVAYVRRKLGREVIVTVPGKGYMMGK